MRRLKLGLAISGLLAPTLSYALGLGEISTNSALNQPLNAEIELVSTAPSELENVTVRLAPESVFEQVGISRTSVLDKLRFTPTVENGVPVIKVTSTEPIQEPFINFVIEVDWPKGKLLREYTVLLDPPVLGEPAAGVAQAPAVTAPAEAPAATAAEPTPEAVAEEGQPPFVSGAPAAQPEPAVAAAETETVESIPLAETYPVEVEPVAPVEVAVEEKVVEKQGLPVAEEKEVAVEVPAEDIGEGLPPFVDQTAAAPETVAQAEAAPEVEVETYPVTEGEVLTEQVEPFDLEGSKLDELPLAETYPVEEEAVPAVEETVVEEAAPAAPGDTYVVQRGDTLFSIAKRYSPSLGANIDQVMVGFLRQNPRAFINRNMNLLKAGYVLRVPDEQVLAGIDPREARQEVARQNALWRQYRSKLAEAPVPQQKVAEQAQAPVAGIRAMAGEEEKPTAGLEILTPEGGEEGGAAQGTAEAGTEKAGAGAVDEKQVALLREQLESAQQENKELKSRVAELEALLQAKDRLIQLKDAQLAELQQKLGGAELTQQPAEGEGGEAAAAGGEETTAAAEQPGQAEQPAEAAEQPTGLLAKQPAAEEATAAGEETAQPEAQPEEETAQLAQAEEEQAAEEETAPSLGEDLRKNPNLLMGAGIGALLLAVLAWLVFRRKKPEPAPAPAGEGGGTQAFTGEGEPEAGPGETQVTEPPAEEEVVEAEATEVPAAEAEGEGEEKTQTIVLDMDDLQMPEEEEGPVTTSASIAELQPGEEDEVLSEANVYLAYGLHEQAVEVLSKALGEHPDRIDYKVKLLEAYHGAKDSDAFVRLAAEVKDELSAKDPDAWQKVAAMGKELAPDNEMFAGADLDALAASAVQSVPDQPADTGFDLDASLTGGVPDESLGGAAPESMSLSPEGEEEEAGVEIEKDQAGEFRLPDLDELSKSLQIDTSEDEDLASLRDNAPGLGGEFSVDESELTLADVDNELTSMTTGADEMATKLDLAKAYMDMGDDEGAREALEEVAANGNDEQKQEAQRLLDQLG